MSAQRSADAQRVIHGRQVSFYLERHACYLVPALSVPKSWDSTIPGECSPEECVCLPVLVYFALDKHEDG